ncbi:hypothetical protein PG993_013341 [Apiospora rasikravindrae]|uniref:Fungal STAND N-terminal Goodbye domain-containing protein n=1 Tax=Apiospora rasikravindrae TaxID=990691 RepID=A0ABR1RXD5_9PEZI
MPPPPQAPLATAIATSDAKNSNAILSPTGAEAARVAAQKEIDTIWAQVHQRVQQLADREGKPQRKGMSIDDVLGVVHEIQKSRKEESEKYGWFKNAVTNTLKCIQTIGGIVASGASEVFAPSDMCFNALTFVIEAWQKYEGMFENLGELLVRCCEFLERLDYYDGNMDIRLTRLACQNLQLFVEICDHSIRLKKKHHKFAAFMKRLFLNDDNISGLLGMMDKLNNKENLLVNAQTYKIVSDSAGDIKLILEGQREQKKEDDAKKWRKSIARALKFPNSALGSDGEPFPTWQRTFDARKDRLIEGTGQWILEKEAFKDWLEAEESTNPFLVIEGAQNSGKTSLIANTLRLLRKGERVSTTSRTVSAYFFADSDKRKYQDGEEPNFLEVATRTMLWQVATAFEAMTKSMAQIAERKHEFQNTVDIWQQLFINNKERINNDTSFFFFIDASESDVRKLKELLQRLGSISDGKRVQIMLSASPETKSWLKETLGSGVGVIPISECNGSDIDTFIESRMNTMPILKDVKRTGISDWRTTIFNTLREKCEGDYFKLHTNLKDLEKVDLVDDIMDVLENAGKSRTDQIDAALRNLNSIRTPKEIDEINEIMLWINDGCDFLPVEAMESIVAIKHRRTAHLREQASPVPSTHIHRRKTGQTVIAEKVSAPSSNLTVSLLPFKKKLLDKYDPLFTVTDSNQVNWRSDELMQRIPVKAGSTINSLNGRSDRPVIGGLQVIQEAEINIVRHFLSSVCPPDLYSRFDFEQFFHGRIGAGQKQSICLDPDNAHIRIVITCLIILTDEGYRKNRQLRDYAALHLLFHLDAVDLSAADLSKDLKAEVGPLLVKLFTEESGIDALFWPVVVSMSFKTWSEDEGITLQETRGEWVYSAEGVRQVALWLKDSMVVKHVDQAAEALIERVKAPDANLHEAVLGRAAKHMAEHMFRRAEFTKQQFLAAAYFIRGYLGRLDKRKAKKMKDDSESYTGANRGTSPFEMDAFTIEELARVEEWASGVLSRAQDTPQQASQWEIHCALAVFQLCRDEEGAAAVYQSRAERALELDPRNWYACHFLTKQSKMSDADAIELLSRAKREIDVDRREDPAKWAKDSGNPALLARITLELGDRQWRLGTDLKSAAQTHRESVHINYVHFRDYVPILERYLEKKEYAEFIAFIEAINHNQKKWALYLEDLVHEFLGNHKVQESQILAQAANAADRWDVVEALFDSAIELAKEKESYDLLFYLHNGKAKTLAAATNESLRTKVVEVQKNALKVLKKHPSDAISPYTVEDIKNSLAQGYLTIAFITELPAEQLQSYGSKIEKLVPESDDKANVWTSIDRTCCLIRFHHKQKSENKAASEWIRKIVRAGLELLSDGDFDNDDMAYWVLARLFATVGDRENSQIVWRLRNLFQLEAKNRWDSWLASQPSDIQSVARDRNSATFRRTVSEVSSERVDASTNGPTLSDAQAPPSKLLEMVSEEPVPEKEVDETASSDGSSTQESDTEPVSDATGSKGSASSSSSVLDNAPMEPTTMVFCAGCRNPWTIVDVDMYVCADCVGTQHLCQGCYDRLPRGELSAHVSLKCRPGHEHVKIPAWDPAAALAAAAEEGGEGAAAPKNSVPLPQLAADGKTTWISVDKWKAKLRDMYLDGAGKASETGA